MKNLLFAIILSAFAVSAMADEGRVVYSAAYEDIYQYKTGKIINLEINGS